MADNNSGAWPPVPQTKEAGKVELRPNSIAGPFSVGLGLLGWVFGAGASVCSVSHFDANFIKAGFLLLWFITTAASLVFGVMSRRTLLGKLGLTIAGVLLVAVIAISILSRYVLLVSSIH